MKAAYLKKYGGPEVLEVGELPDPKPGDNDVLVSVRCSALNHLDIWVRNGIPSLKLSFPHVLGSDAAGVVKSAGARVKGVAAGDEVIVHPGLSSGVWEEVESLDKNYRILGEHVSGTNAALIAVPAANVFPKPANLSWEEAASVPLVYTTAFQMVARRARVQPGDLVLVHAAGSGVSSAAIQLLKVMGATVIATSRHARKLELARKLGADHVVDISGGGFASAVRDIAGKRGVDLVVDHVGAATWSENFACLRWGGSIVTCGATSGHDVSVDLRQIFYRQIQVLGSTMGSKGDFPRVLGLLKSGRVRAVVDRAFPLDEIARAHRYLEASEPFGKVVLNVS